MNFQQWLSKLIGFDTTSSNSNLELINTISDWFAHFKIPTQLTYDATGKKANLFATLPAKDGSTQHGLLLSGHTDTVPVTGQTWNTDPFQVVQIQDRFYGRGTCDMKGFLAAVLSLIPEWQRSPLKRPLHFAFSYDEEIGCRGVPLLITDFKKRGIQPDFCIVGEPTLMLPVTAHKGINVYRCKVQGQAVHSSLTPQGSNAIEYAARLIVYLRELAEHYKSTGPFDTLYDVPYTTMTTNLIQGGNAINTLPAHCEFIYEFRNLPETQPSAIESQINDYIEKKLLPKMHQEYTSATIDLEKIAAVPGLLAIEHNFIQQLRELCQDQTVHKVSYATEAGFFQQAHIPTLICGPGSIEQAHKANEYVSLEQLDRCVNFLSKLTHLDF